MPPVDGRRACLPAIVAGGRPAHAGLWLDKYLSSLRLPDAGMGGDAGEAEAGVAIRTLLGEAAGTVTPEGYLGAFQRRRAALERLTGGVEGGVTSLFTATARGRLIVGLGAHAVRETNIALLHTWGVPYIPGSALKGLASAVAHRVGAAAEWKKAPEQGDDHELLFGSTSQAGYVTFHDAWWIPADEGAKLPLDLDVMTVHHADYYRDGTVAPGDWDDPNPVAFLTAHGSYLVALSGPGEWVARAAEWLDIGLQEIGVGAKTQAGYGRMTLERVLTEQELEEQRGRAQFAARIRELEGLRALGIAPGNAKMHLQKLLAARAEGVPAEDVCSITRSLFQRDLKTWKSWDKQSRWSPEQRTLLVEAGILPQGGKSG